MRQRTVRLAQVAAITAIFLISLATGTGTATAAAGAGLWTSNYVATGETDRCAFYRDSNNNICYIDDGGSVELGVKFTTSERVLASGVRVYRVDAGAVTGSLWKADGTLLATGTFANQAGRGWQDLVFVVPVLLEPYTTYIASYFAPNADYAFEWYFFSYSAFTVGPITAVQSVEGNRNGVYCYDFEPCWPLPTNSFRDTNYWVSPLWAYAFDGFYQPVDNGMWNKAKAGSAIPVKFSLDGNRGLNILKTGYPKATLVTCPSASTPTDVVEETVAASTSGLTYDPYADQYVYVWKTDKTWAGKCYRFELGLKDDTPRTFLVQFFK